MPDADLARPAASPPGETAVALLPRDPILEAALDCVVVIDASGRVTAWNAASERTFGWSREEAVGRPLAELIVPPHLRESHARGLARYLATGEARAIGRRQEFPAVTKDGAEILVEVAITEAPGAGGRAFVGFLRDITHRKSADFARGRLLAELESERRRLASVMENLPAVVWETRVGAEHGLRDGFVSAFAERALGYAPNEWLSTPTFWIDVVHPDDRERVRTAVRDMAERGAPGEMRFRWVARDGRVVHALANVTLALDDAGRAIGIRGVALDVTAEGRAVEALRESEARYAFLADAVPHHVWTATPDGRLDYVNARFRASAGREVEKLLGDGWRDLLHPEDAPGALQRWKRSLESGEPFQAEIRLQGADGAYRWHLARAVPQRDALGRVARWFGSSVDVHDLKEMQHALADRARTLARITDALARSNRELDQFAYATSHDLKAPLRGIASLSRWIEEDLGERLTEESRGHLALLRGRVERMEALIEGILQYSRVGRVRGRLEPVDVKALLTDVVDLLAPPSGFRVAIPEELPTIVAERLRLEQVFMNLISNAIKHHDRPDGRVDVRVEDAGAFWRFEVADDGPGIEPRFHDRVFVIFQTLSSKNRGENTGVGLALVKKIVENVGGTVTLESELGKGATFRFTWPKQPIGGD